MLAACELAAEPLTLNISSTASAAALAAAVLRSTGHQREISAHFEILGQCIVGGGLEVRLHSTPLLT